MNAPEHDIGFAEVDEILRIIDQFPAAEIVYERGDLKLHVRRAGAAPAAALPAAAAAPTLATAAPAAAAEAAPAAGAAGATPAPARAAPVARDGLVSVDSPLMGVFYAAPAPGAEPFVRIGQAVSAGDDLCIIEVMKVMNMVKAPVAGVVEDIGADNAAMVERGQALMWIRPAEGAQ